MAIIKVILAIGKAILTFGLLGWWLVLIAPTFTILSLITGNGIVGGIITLIITWLLWKFIQWLW